MATKRKITKKVIPPVVSSVKEEAPVEEVVSRLQADSSDGQTSEGPYKRERAKRECFFCKSKVNPSYTDLANLRRYLTDRAKIVGKERTGVCSKHQRRVTKNIKYARHLSLLPFVPKV